MCNFMTQEPRPQAPIVKAVVGEKFIFNVLLGKNGCYVFVDLDVFKLESFSSSSSSADVLVWNVHNK